MSPVITVSIISIALILLFVGIARMKPEVEREPKPLSHWNVRVYNPSGILVRDFSYPYTAVDEQMLREAEDPTAEVEDEAASYASFEFFMQMQMQMPELNEHYLAIVEHPTFGSFRFRPDFEHGHMVGVREYVMHGNTEKEVGVVEQLQ